jgi:hypothetical protein
MRDFYDIVMLLALKGQTIDRKIMQEALKATAARRHSSLLFHNSSIVFEEISGSEDMEHEWKIFQKNYPYAQPLGWLAVLEGLKKAAVLSGLEA